MEEQNSKDEKNIQPEANNEVENLEIIKEQEEDEGLKPDIEKLRKKLKECIAEKQKYLDGWQRTQADFANFRRRNEEQFSEWLKMFGEGLIKDILPVLDSLDAAVKSQPEDQGLTTLKDQLYAVLKKHGLTEIKSVGEKFNPEFHEVIESEEGDKSHSDEIVIEEIQKGYMLNGKILRVAKIKVKK